VVENHLKLERGCFTRKHPLTQYLIMPLGIYKRTAEQLEKLKKQGFQKGHPGTVTDIHRKNISKALKGNTNWDNPNSVKAQFKKGVHNNVGKNNPMWKDGITPEIRKIRNSPEMKLWRKSVFERDNFVCQKYRTSGGILRAHHINNFADFPELRLAIDNGITLSEKAHKEFHKIYGRRNNTQEQLEEFLS